MKQINIDGLECWINYVNGWMSFWNAVDLACFGAVFCWLTAITIWVARK